MPVAANNLAWMYAETGENLDMALQLAQAAARRLPNNPAIQDTLGWIYYKKGLATLAIAPFQKSIELDPKNPVFHYHLGLAHLKNGDSLEGADCPQRRTRAGAEFRRRRRGETGPRITQGVNAAVAIVDRQTPDTDLPCRQHG